MSTSNPTSLRSYRRVIKEVRLHLLDPLELKTVLIALFRSPDYTPPVMPALMLEALTISRDPNASAEAVAALVGHDPLLAAQVMRKARSASCAASTPIRSLNAAIVHLGNRRVANLFVRSWTEARVFRARTYAGEMEALRRHCVFVAELTRVLAGLAAIPEDDAYLCGLLHDVGIAAILLAMDEAGIHVPIDQARACILELHEPCAEYLARVWGLPSDVVQLLGLHHSLVFDGEDQLTTALVALADGISHEVGLGFAEGATPDQTEAAARAAGLDAEALQRARDAATRLARDFLP